MGRRGCLRNVDKTVTRRDRPFAKREALPAQRAKPSRRCGSLRWRRVMEVAKLRAEGH